MPELSSPLSISWSHSDACLNITGIMLPCCLLQFLWQLKDLVFCFLLTVGIQIPYCFISLEFQRIFRLWFLFFKGLNYVLAVGVSDVKSPLCCVLFCCLTGDFLDAVHSHLALCLDSPIQKTAGRRQTLIVSSMFLSPTVP